MSLEMTPKKFAAGELVFKEGDAPDSIYLINKGTVEIFKGNMENKQVIATLGWNKIFGEMAMVDKKPRSASAVAKEETWVYVMSNAEFEQKLKNMDPFMRGIVTTLSELIRNFSSRQ